MARAALGGLIAGILMFLVMYFVVGFGAADAFYLSLSFATAVSAAVAATEKEANLGVVAGFAGICIASLLVHYLGFVKVGGILVRLPSFTVVVPTSLVPILAVGFAGLIAAALALGWDSFRFVVYLCGVAAWIAYVVSPEAVVRLTAVTVVALVTSIPFVFEDRSDRVARFMSVAPIPIIAAVDLSGVVDVANLFIPILMFLAVDPTRRLGSTARGLAAICVLTVVLLVIVDIALLG